MKLFGYRIIKEKEYQDFKDFSLKMDYKTWLKIYTKYLKSIKGNNKLISNIEINISIDKPVIIKEVYNKFRFMRLKKRL